MPGWQEDQIVQPAPVAPAGGGSWQEDAVVPEDEWERAVLLPMETNKATGERRLAVPGFIDAAIGAAALPGDVLTGKTALDPRTSYKDAAPETLDRAAVLAGMAPLSGAGMALPRARNLVDESGTPIPRLLARDMEAADITPATLRQRVGALGPAGIIGDLSPRLQARVGAVANTPGAGQDMIIEALRARQLGANARISSGVDDILGPAQIPSEHAARIRAAQQELSPEYQRALANAESGDISAVANYVDNAIMQEKGAARSAMQRVREFLNFSAPDIPGVPRVAPMLDRNPTGWLKARQAIDGMLETEADPNVIRVLTDTRRMLDEALTQHVPGIKDVDARFADLARQNEALTSGQRVLESGRTAIRPEELAAEYASATPGVRRRMREGVRAEIERLIGTTANDRVALRGILKGDGSWNRERLTTLYGEERANRLIDLLDAEATMQQTENLAFGNSKTEIIRSAKEGIEPAQKKAGPVASAANFKFGDAAAGVADALAGGMLRKRQQAKNEAIARALLSGAEGWRAVPSTALPGVAPLMSPALLDALIETGKDGGVIRAFR